MAQVIPLTANPRKGFTIGALPMPDGSRRSYKAYGKNAIREIMARWKAECDLIRATLAGPCGNV